MFLSNSRKFIFIHITKAAGTSITYALEKSMSWNDLVIGSTPLGAELQKYYLERFNLQKHSKAVEVRQVIGNDLWENYFTFTFTRHPYTRVLSLYTYIENLVLGKGWKRYLRGFPFTKIHWAPIWNWSATRAYLDTNSFSEFIRHPILVWEPGMKPQSEWLLDQDGNVMVDFIGQVESIEKDFAFVLDQVGLDSAPLQVYNKSQRKDRQPPEITEADYTYLGKVFEHDFQVLNYDPALRIPRTKSG